MSKLSIVAALALVATASANGIREKGKFEPFLRLNPGVVLSCLAFYISALNLTDFAKLNKVA
jgi:hypothetical protein